jgi:hypothetical protein
MISSVDLCIAILSVIKEVSWWEKTGNSLYPAGNAIDRITDLRVTLITSGS